MKYLLALLALIVFVNASNGQRHDYYFKNYQVSDGLANNTITAITQDIKGFMWFGWRKRSKLTTYSGVN